MIWNTEDNYKSKRHRWAQPNKKIAEHQVKESKKQVGKKIDGVVINDLCLMLLTPTA